MDTPIVYPKVSDENMTFRKLIHQKTVDHPWAAFGNDLLLGVMADRPITPREQQFLPEILSRDLDKATVEREGSMQPFVLRHVTHIPAGIQVVEKEFLLSPFACTLLILLVSIAIFICELRTKKVMVWWDVLLMLATGLPGCILLIMVFSDHPATSLNLQLLLLNPLSLLFIPSVIRRRHTHWFSIMTVCVLAFFIGGFWQDYADGMECVALCLLLRYWIHQHDK